MASILACYASCGSAVSACFAAAGFTFGTVPGAQIAAIPALAACNAQFATCEAACMAAGYEIQALAAAGLLGVAAGVALPATAAVRVGYYLYSLFFQK